MIFFPQDDNFGAGCNCFSNENGVTMATVGWDTWATNSDKLIFAESKASSDVFGVENGVLKCFIKPLNSSTVTVPEGVSEISLSIGQNVGYTGWANDEYSQYWTNNTIVIPQSVKKIGLNEKDPSTGDSYFWGELSYIYTLSGIFSNIEVDEANLNYASYDGALYNKDLTELICCSYNMGGSLPSFPVSLKSIGAYAFSGGTCNFGEIETITIPDGVISIGESAFEQISFKNFIIPESVQSIGSNCISQSYEDSVITVYGTNTHFEPNSIKTDWDNSTKAIVRGYSGSTAEQYVLQYNAEHPDRQIIFESLDTESPIVGVKYGDVDNNQRLTATDSACVLQKVLNTDFKLPIEEIDSDYMKFADVDNDGVLTASDAAMILEKVRRKDFVFPIEK